MHVILDFDGTITVNDTIGVLAAAAVAFQTERQDGDGDGDDDGDGDGDVDWNARWTKVVDDYVADHKRHAAGYAPAEARRTTLADELAYLRSLRDVDGGSIRALHDAGLFKGMPPRHIARAGQAAVQAASADKVTDGVSDGVRVRPGFSQFLAQTAARQWPVSIVSVNWSDAWIRGVVAEHEGGDSIRILTNAIAESGAIVANFARAGPGSSTRPVSSCRDKLEALQVAAVRAAESSTGAIGTDEPVLYMGDSTTDLECLMHAARGSRGGGGIVLADGDGPATSKLLQTLARLGYRVPHVAEAGRGRFRARPATDSTGPEAPRLAWARDFEEIMASAILDGR